MHKTYRRLLFFIVYMMQAMSAFPRASLQDRIKGAVMGSATGGALGRIAERFETGEELRKAYGTKGLSSFYAFKKDDWAYDTSNNEFALLSHHSTLAFLVLDTLIYGRLHNLGEQAIEDIVRKRMIARCGQNGRIFDPYFEEGCSQWCTPDGKRILPAVESGNDKKLPLSSGLVRAWPYGLVFYDDSEIVKRYVTAHMLLTHRDSTTRSAAVALAVGISHAAKGDSPDDVVKQMVHAAEQFDELEKEKPHARKVHSFDKASARLISKNLMLTSDMIRYAEYCAKNGCQPETVLGTTRKTNQHNRSPYNFLLGYEPDEALAAAVYVFVRHSAQARKAITEASNAAGCSALIGSLLGALVGAHVGMRQLVNDDFEDEIEMIERVNELQVMANNLFVTLCDAPSYCPV